MIECRICEYCGERNPVSALECCKCGSDLSFCAPVILEDLDANKAEKKVWKLNLGTESFTVDDSLEIGRESSKCKHLLTSPYVSRKHATLFQKDGHLVLIDYSTNGTFVNGIRVSKNVEVGLKSGDKIAFADVIGSVNAD